MQRMFKHEDERRTLYEFGTAGIAAVKVLTVKDGCTVGDHYHEKKDEKFVLAAGKGDCQIGIDWHDMEIGKVYECPRGTYHRFDLEPGSVLIGTASESFDPMDELKK